MAIVKKISELTPKGSPLANTDLLIVGVDNGTDYDLKSVTGAQVLGNVVSQTITDGVTTKSPSENVLFDALALKVDKVAGSRLITSAEATILGNTSGTNTGDQSLQSVTNLGATTSNAISTQNATFQSSLAPSQIQTQRLSNSKRSSLNADGFIAFSTTGTAEATLKATNILNDVTLEVPNKSLGSYTIATTSDFSGTNTGDQDLSGLMVKSNNLSDLTNTTTARSNLGLGSLATQSGTFSGTSSGTNTGDQIISDATITTSDITTNDVSITKHGFAPKAPNNTTTFLRGDGTWATPAAGGLTFFSEAQNTTAPNATVNVDSLTAVASTTNADFAIRPKGTGAILGRIPDGTGVGGNKRGANAVDLQTFQDQPELVASGNYSVIAGGQGNKSTAINSSILGGYYNSATGQYSTVVGGITNQSIGSFSVTGGRDNIARGVDVLFGEGNSTVSSVNYNIAGGYYNVITNGYHSTAFGGYNSLNGYYHVAGGESNTLTSAYGSIVFGYNGQDNGLSRFIYANRGYVKGDTQASKVLLNRRTTNATTLPLIIQIPNGATADATNQLTLRDNNSIRFKGTIIGRQSASTNTSAWDIDGIIQRGVGAATTTLLIGNVNVVQNTPAWGTPTLTANTTLGCLTVSVIGALTTNIQWTCAIDTIEVIYA